MSREIKFRAWDSEKEEMAQVVTLDEEEITLTDGALTYWKTVRDYIAYVMQYTGIKDKNGVEIYEGDVVLTTEREHKVKNVIIFDKGAFYIRSEPLLDELLNECKDIEVVGNIHQHPHLLEVPNGS